MELYNVQIFPAAQKDFIEIIEYINTLSSSAALRYYDSIYGKDRFT